MTKTRIVLADRLVSIFQYTISNPGIVPVQHYAMKEMYMYVHVHVCVIGFMFKVSISS